MQVAGYSLTNRGVTVDRKPNVRETRAHLDVHGPWSGTISSGDNQYVNPPEPSREVGIKTDWLRGEDLYVIVDETHADGSIYVQVLVKPLVNLIWIAGIVFLLGSAVAMWPDAREQRRLVARLVPA
jgi:cytochrome c biogenesis factor